MINPTVEKAREIRDALFRLLAELNSMTTHHDLWNSERDALTDATDNVKLALDSADAAFRLTNSPNRPPIPSSAAHEKIEQLGERSIRKRKALGAAIRTARATRDLTQSQVAQKVAEALASETNQGNISKIETGEVGVSQDMLYAIADALDTPLSKIYQIAEEEIHALQDARPLGLATGFADRLRALRAAADLTQEGLAAACGFSGQSRVSNYEQATREPSIDDLNLLAKALQVPVGTLVDPAEFDTWQQQPPAMRRTAALVAYRYLHADAQGQLMIFAVAKASVAPAQLCR